MSKRNKDASKEIRVKILQQNPEELAAWVFEQQDAVYRQTHRPGDADEFRNHLLGRINADLTPEEDHELGIALIDYWCRTELDEHGNRVTVNRAERRRRESELNKRLTERQTNRSCSPGNGMCVDANGEVLISDEKLAEVLEVPVEEIEHTIEKLLEEHPEWAGYAPRKNERGEIEPMKVLDGDSDK